MVSQQIDDASVKKRKCLEENIDDLQNIDLLEDSTSTPSQPDTITLSKPNTATIQLHHHK